MALLLSTTGMDQRVWLERLRDLAPGRDIRAYPDVGDPEQIDFAAVWKQSAGALKGLPNLRGIVSLGAGVDHLFDDPDLPDVPLGRVKDDDLTGRMSEWVVLHALMHLRRQRLYDRQQGDGVWRDHDLAPAAHQLRVGVMGMGVLGADAAAKLRVIGFDVAGWSRSGRAAEGAPAGLPLYPGEQLDLFLAPTDLLVCLLPLTPDTRGILARPLFRKLARDGVFGAPALMNAGRGGLQVESDILASLDDGILVHATLDVFETEPLPATSPLWRHPGVTISPHNAATSDPEAVGRFVLRQWARIERGDRCEAPVQRGRRY